MLRSSIFLLLLLLDSCGRNPKMVQMMNQGPAQGSTFSISYIVPEGIDYRIEIDSILDEIDAQMSLWIEDSEISRLNRGDSIYLSSSFHSVIMRSLLYSELSGGAFDITIGPLIKAWGFSGGVRKDQVNVDSLIKYVGYERLIVSRPDMSEKYALPYGFKIDVNGIAQGFTVDLVVNFLKNKGVENYMVEIGGEVSCKGKNINGHAWRIGIEEPNKQRIAGQFQTIIELDTMSLATSGNYRKYWEDESGQKVVHSIDPETGIPFISNLLSASVIAPNATMADALATASMIKGVLGAIEMIEQSSSTEAYFIVGTEFGEIEVQQTSGWEKYSIK
ncbi:MAG: FAD:protein FMN transferase [Bacteroidota bacterium]|nr:FAD:protein FMN transferase [Bacteroidota bacterium]